MLLITFYKYKRMIYEWLLKKFCELKKHGVIREFYVFMYSGPSKNFDMIGYLYNDEYVVIIKEKNVGLRLKEIMDKKAGFMPCFAVKGGIVICGMFYMLQEDAETFILNFQ